MALIYNAFFLWRRLLFAIIIVLLKERPSLRIVLFFYQSIGLLIYVVLVKPFEDPQQNKIEIFNELCILLSGYHLIAFTDFIPQGQAYDEVRGWFGYSMIGITALNVVVNTTIAI